MSEQNQHESDRGSRPTTRSRRTRDPEGQRALSRMDEAHEVAHQADRVAPARRETFPKDDRRSSTLLTDRERSERWPLG